jgi:hypothetical protein
MRRFAIVSRSWSISQRMPSRTAASVEGRVVGELERLRNDVDIELKEDWLLGHQVHPDLVLGAG